MATNIASQITSMQSSTNEMKASQTKTLGANQELGQDAFLNLMMEQLKYQDPLKPVGNAEFLSQQAQFTQVNELQKLNDNTTLNNQAMQASSLIGKEVTVINPDDPTKTVTGTVTTATFSGGIATIGLNGKEYPLGYITKIAQPGTAAATTGTTTNTDSTTES